MDNRLSFTLVKKPIPKTPEGLKKDEEEFRKELEKNGCGKIVKYSNDKEGFAWNIEGASAKKQESLHQLALDLISGKIVQMNKDNLIEI